MSETMLKEKTDTAPVISEQTVFLIVDFYVSDFWPLMAVGEFGHSMQTHHNSADSC
jgi:hypothetical protein